MVGPGAGMSRAALGNDVVDLRDADAQPDTLHPRFDEKAFHAGERTYIGSGPGVNRRRWSLWAAKEAAHKALRQEAPELGFAPRHYHASLDESGQGLVRRGEDEISVRVDADGEHVHAVAFRGDASDVLGALASLPEGGEADPSRAVRELLYDSLPPGLPARLDRRERIPRLELDGQALPVSFSHHGRFVAMVRRGGRS